MSTSAGESSATSDRGGLVIRSSICTWRSSPPAGCDRKPSPKAHGRDGRVVVKATTFSLTGILFRVSDRPNHAAHAPSLPLRDGDGICGLGSRPPVTAHGLTGEDDGGRRPVRIGDLQAPAIDRVVCTPVCDSSMMA
jgi:hypothetical protein